MQRRRGEQIFYQAFGVSSDWQNISQHYWRARSMNRKDGRSIDWRWASLIPLSADDGVYGDQNKSVKKARDDAKGKLGIFFVLGSAGSFIFILFSFLSPIVFFVVSYSLFCLHFYIQIGSHKVRISALLFIECFVSLRPAHILPSSVEIVAA